MATENRWINWISMGEGMHSYHHVFAQDYRNCGFEWWEVFNPASLFIEVCTLLRFASDQKKPSSNLVRLVIEHKGEPEYFGNARSMKQRVLFGIFDWIVGLLLAQYPLWIVIAFKICSGQQLIVT